jgi:DNA-binding GntR family transcriptional regulator
MTLRLASQDRGVSADAAEHLRAAIRTGRILPGDRILERSVTEELGISSIAVREAFARLVQEGWLERQPRRGVRVRRLGSAEVDDITDARSLVEGEAAVLASRRIVIVGDADLRRLPGEMDRVARRCERAELLSLDEAFHTALWRLAGSPTLEELLLNLRARITPLMRLSLEMMSPSELRCVGRWHAELLEALHHGEQAARNAVARHNDLTRDRVRNAASSRIGLGEGQS